MTTPDHPITKEELREELKHYATKADLANAKVDIIKWFAGSMLAGMAVMTGVAAVLLRLWA